MGAIRNRSAQPFRTANNKCDNPSSAVLLGFQPPGKTHGCVLSSRLIQGDHPPGLRKVPGNVFAFACNEIRNPAGSAPGKVSQLQYFAWNPMADSLQVVRHQRPYRRAFRFPDPEKFYLHTRELGTPQIRAVILQKWLRQFNSISNRLSAVSYWLSVLGCQLPADGFCTLLVSGFTAFFLIISASTSSFLPSRQSLSRS